MAHDAANHPTTRNGCPRAKLRHPDTQPARAPAEPF